MSINLSQVVLSPLSGSYPGLKYVRLIKGEIFSHSSQDGVRQGSMPDVRCRHTSDEICLFLYFNVFSLPEELRRKIVLWV